MKYLYIALATASVMFIYTVVTFGGDGDLETRIRLVESRDPKQLPSLLSSLTTTDKQLLVNSRDDHIAALGISSLSAKDGDHSLWDRIRTRFHSTIPTHGVDNHDLHQPSSPKLQLLVAASYVLATVDTDFLSVLIKRREFWDFPERFTDVMPKFQPGWVELLATTATTGPDRGSAGYLIASAADIRNEAELVKLLHTANGAVWKGALQACIKLKTDPCKAALGEAGNGGQSGHQSGQQTLSAMTAVFRLGSISSERFNVAIHTAAKQADVAQSINEYADFSLELLSALTVCSMNKCALLPLTRSVVANLRNKSLNAVLDTIQY